MDLLQLDQVITLITNAMINSNYRIKETQMEQRQNKFF